MAFLENSSAKISVFLELEYQRLRALDKREYLVIIRDTFC